MLCTFTIQGQLAGLNEIVNQTRINRFAGASQKKKETQRCEWAILAGSVPTFSSPVKVKFRWVEPHRRRDPDNVSVGAKFILDALVNRKRIPNDTREWIKDIEHSFPEPDPKNPRVEVTIMENAIPEA